MKNFKLMGAILQVQEAAHISRDLGLKFHFPCFSTDGGIFDGWVHVWEFVKYDEDDVIKEWHYFYTDAYNVFNIYREEEHDS
jgi:hypothetical protein